MEHSLWQFFTDNRPSILVNLAKVFAAVGDDSVLLPLAVLLALYGLATGRRTVATLGPVFAMVPTFVVVGVLKTLIDRDRPPAARALVEVTSASMPSGHAAYAAALAATAWVVVAGSNKSGAWRVSAVAAAVVAGVSRMVLGVHWVGDVIAGWAVGATIGFCVVRAVGKRLQSNA